MTSVDKRDARVRLDAAMQAVINKSASDVIKVRSRFALYELLGISHLSLHITFLDTTSSLHFTSPTSHFLSFGLPFVSRVLPYPNNSVTSLNLTLPFHLLLTELLFPHITLPFPTNPLHSFSLTLLALS
jgi:hypothetical protein